MANNVLDGGSNAHAVLDDAYNYLKERGVEGHHYTKILASANGSNGYPNINHHAKPSVSNDLIRPRIFVLSAQDKEGLKRIKFSMAEFLNSNTGDNASNNEQKYLADLAYTLSHRKSKLQWKTYRIASTLEELSRALIDEENTALVQRSSQQPRIGFVFTGQGAQVCIFQTLIVKIAQ